MDSSIPRTSYYFTPTLNSDLLLLIRWLDFSLRLPNYGEQCLCHFYRSSRYIPDREKILLTEMHSSIWGHSKSKDFVSWRVYRVSTGIQNRENHWLVVSTRAWGDIHSCVLPIYTVDWPASRLVKYIQYDMAIVRCHHDTFFQPYLFVGISLCNIVFDCNATWGKVSKLVCFIECPWIWDTTPLPKMQPTGYGIMKTARCPTNFDNYEWCKSSTSNKSPRQTL